MPTYQTRNPLARTSPLRSIPLIRTAQPAHTPECLSTNMLSRTKRL